MTLRKLKLLSGWLLVSCAIFGATGCASRAAFDTTFPVGRDADLKNVLGRISGKTRAAQTPVVVGVTNTPRGVFAFDLSAQRLLFSTSADVSGVPVAAGPFVVVPEGERVRVRDLNTGRMLHDIDADGLHFIGADSDGDVTALVLSTGGSYGAHSLLVILRGGTITKKIRIDHALGGPAVLGGLIFLPHSRVHLSALTPEGEELMRLVVRDDVASQALSDGRNVYFGLAGVYLLDGETQKGTQAGAHYFAPSSAVRRQLPGAPAFLPDSSEAPPPIDSAVHRIKLSFTPQSSAGEVGSADDALYLSFYRLVFSLTEKLDSAHWVRSSASDIVGVQAHSGGVVIVEERGTVSAIDTTGSALFETDMGVKPIVASIRADDLHASGSGAPLPPLVQQLSAAVLHDDTRLVPAGELAIRLMADLPDDEVTSTLITICGQRDAPGRLRESACEVLGGRKQGNAAILGALAKRSDYLADTSAEPLAPLAKAAAASEETRAAPLLLDHLEDPSTPSEDLPAIMQALLKLADVSAKQRVLRFVRLYHADANDPPLAEALVAAVPLIVKLDASEAQSVLESLAKDPRTEATLHEAAAKQALALAEAAEKAKTSEAAAGDGETTAGAPNRLTAAQLNHALIPVHDSISQCVRNDPAHPIEARLTVVVDGTGQVSSVQTLPATLTKCVEPLVRKVALPAPSSGKRETLHSTISR